MAVHAMILNPPRSRRYRRPIKVPGRMTWQKARIILHHGEVRGHKITSQQRKFFGAIFSRLKPKRLSREQAKKIALSSEKSKGSTTSRRKGSLMAKRGRKKGRRRGHAKSAYQKFLSLCRAPGRSRRRRFSSGRRSGRISWNPDEGPTLGGFRTLGVEEAHAAALGQGRVRSSASRLRGTREAIGTLIPHISAFHGGPARGRRRLPQARRSAQRHLEIELKLREIDRNLAAAGISPVERAARLEQERRKLMAKKSRRKGRGKARAHGGRRRARRGRGIGRRSRRKCKTGMSILGRCRKKGRLKVRGHSIKSRKKYCRRGGKLARHCRRKRKNLWGISFSDKQILKVAGQKLVPFGLGLGLSSLGLTLTSMALRLQPVAALRTGLARTAIETLGITAGALAGIRILQGTSAPLVGGLDNSVGIAMGALSVAAGNLAVNVLGIDIWESLKELRIVRSGGSLKDLYTTQAMLSANLSDHYLTHNAFSMADQVNPTIGFDAPDAIMLDSTGDADFMSDQMHVGGPLALADQFSPDVFSNM